MKKSPYIQDNGDWRSPASFTSWIPLHPSPSEDKAGTNELKERIEASLTKFQDQIVSSCEEMGVVHSCRMVVTPPVEKENYALGLLINLIYDKTEVPVLERLCHILVKALGEFLQTQTHEGLRALLYRHHFPHKTLFLANINRSVEEIKQEQQLYQFLQHELDHLTQQDDVKNHDMEALRLSLRQKVVDSELDLPRKQAVELPVETRKRKRWDLIRTLSNPIIIGLSEDIYETIGRLNGLKRILVKITFILYQIVALLFAVPFGIGVLLTELFEKDVDTGPPSKEKLDRIEDTEDHYPKNSVTLIFPVKYTWIRRMIMNAVLSQAEKGCRHFWTVGKLVQINTLHFARLFLTPSRKTMIFMSDYDGGLDRYLDDFLGVGQRAVVAISSSIHGCPPTRLFKPANMSIFRTRWRMLIRRHQYIDALWYSAYPDLEVDQIMNHHFVRQGLFADHLSTEELTSWLRKL
ncbi:MAG: hypothetical protein AAFW00_18010 [Bacteroidota bacterium]